MSVIEDEEIIDDIDENIISDKVKDNEIKTPGKVQMMSEYKTVETTKPMSSSKKANTFHTVNNSIDQGGKSIFSKISEKLFLKFLESEKAVSHKDFWNLTSDNYLNEEQGKLDKSNNEKVKDLIERANQYENVKKDKMKERLDKYNEDLRSKCTWTPNGVFLSQYKTKEEFFKEQKRLEEERKKKIEKLIKEQYRKDKETHKADLVSKNSIRLIKDKRKNESEEDFIKRLQNEKLKNIKERKRALKSSKTSRTVDQSKKSNKEIEELTNKLYSEHITLRKNKENRINESISQMNSTRESTDLITASTKKLFIDKFMTSYQRALLELFNKQDNIDITYDDYVSLLKKIGCVKEEDDLCKESFNKYLNAKDAHINTDQFIIFAMTFLGIYKGSDEPQFEDEDKKKIPTSTDFIKVYIPSVDMTVHNYQMKAVAVIKKKFLPFCSCLISSWTEENIKKRQEKKEKMSKSTITSNIKSKRDEDKVLSSRKRMFTNISNDNEDTDENPKKVSLADKINKHQIRIEDIYKLLQKRKEKELEILRAQQIAEETKECTFQPNASTRPVDPKEVPAKIEKLYTDGKITYMKKMKMEDRNPNEEIDEACTFQPETTSYTEVMFNYNPIEDDDDVNRKLNRMEKARETKSILDLHKKLGGTDFKIFDYENVEPLPGMRFDIEYKTNKDSFWNYRKRLNNYTDLTGEDSKRRESRIPILKVEVNIDDNDKIVTLEIYQGDDPIKITEHFCAKYGLSEEKKMKLQTVIQEKLNENNVENVSVEEEEIIQ